MADLLGIVFLGGAMLAVGNISGSASRPNSNPLESASPPGAKPAKDGNARNLPTLPAGE